MTEKEKTELLLHPKIQRAFLMGTSAKHGVFILPKYFSAWRKESYLMGLLQESASPPSVYFLNLILRRRLTGNSLKCSAVRKHLIQKISIQVI